MSPVSTLVRPNGLYCFARVIDTTPGQAEWGEDRNNRPEILFQYEPTRHNKGMKAPKMIYQGHLVLDYFDNPVVNYVEIPLTCSSLMEGWLQEAIVRLNPAITGRDFLARMLKDKVNVNALSMRRTRFREKAGCISWTKRAGSDNVKRYMDLILPTVCLDNNSTRAFRDLHRHEIAEMHFGNVGQFPERSRLPDRKTASTEQQLEARAGARKRLNGLKARISRRNLRRVKR